MDEDGPDLDEDEEAEIEVFVHRDKKGEDTVGGRGRMTISAEIRFVDRSYSLVWERLGVSVDWVESERCPWRWH